MRPAGTANRGHSDQHHLLRYLRAANTDPTEKRDGDVDIAVQQPPLVLAHALPNRLHTRLISGR